MLLSYVKLVQLVDAGVIENVELDQINGTSIDITLAPRILVEVGGKVCSLKNREPLNMVTVEMDPERGYILQPNEFILASSQQIFNLPMDISAEYKLKSSMARVGLEHMNAGWCDPGWHGSALTLELKNESRYHSIHLRPGDRIGQVVFYLCDPVPEDRSYAVRGRYNKDVQVSGIKP